MKKQRQDPRALANTSVSPKPSFVLTGLKPGTKYLVNISAFNKKGKSRAHSYPFTTPTDGAERQIGPGKLSWFFSKEVSFFYIQDLSTKVYFILGDLLLRADLLHIDWPLQNIYAFILIL